MSIQSLAFDPSVLAPLKSQSAQNQAGLREAAQQFEAMFLNMMLKSMRAATPESGMFDNEHSRLYREMFDSQISQQISSQRGMGIADLMVQQLGRHVAAGGEKTTANVQEVTTSMPPLKLAANTNVSAAIEDTVKLPPDTTQKWHDADGFVSVILPQAQKVAKKLGIDADVIVAQAALETGWGKKVPYTDAGKNSFNLFGIKAGGSWRGDSVSKATLEFESGSFRQRQAKFRAYDSVEQAMGDYAEFLSGNPRYAQALAAGKDRVSFANALQAAGYATDPQYANKILHIAKSPRLQHALDGARSSARVPTEAI